MEPIQTDQNSPPIRKRSLMSLIGGLLVVLILVGTLTEDWHKVEQFIRASGWLGPVIAIALYGILGATPIPSEPLTVLLTATFGPLIATLACSIGNVLAALVEYFVGDRLGNAAEFLKQKDKLPFGLSKVPVDSPLFLLGARMLPGYGAKFVSIICGVYKVSLWRYLWTTFVATTIGAVLLAYGGFGIIQIWK